MASQFVLGEPPYRLSLSNANYELSGKIMFIFSYYYFAQNFESPTTSVRQDLKLDLCGKGLYHAAEFTLKQQLPFNLKTY